MTESWKTVVSPNLSALFTESPFEQRFALAKQYGFTTVELWPNDGAKIARDETQRLGLTLGLVNVDVGGTGQHGRLSHPDAQAWWRARFDESLDLASATGARAICCIAGNRQPGVTMDEHRDVMAGNLGYALCLVEGSGICLLLEPLNVYDRPYHVLHTVEQFRDIRRLLGDPVALRLLFDAFHLEQNHGNLSALVRSCADIIGYVQIADVPGRHEPGTGRILWETVIDALRDIDYAGPVGLEFLPTGSTDEALNATSRFLELPQPT